jgi:hypothetical protein
MTNLLLPLQRLENRKGRQRRVFDCVLRELVESERVFNGQDQQASVIIVDSRSVKNTYTAKAEGI